MNQRKRQRLYLQLYHDVLDAPAWRAMSVHGRLLYIALRRRHNTKHSNNGDIFISQREAAKELKFTRPTIAKGFKEMEHYGFAVMTSPGYLGVDGKGKSPHWMLTEFEINGEPPTRDFERWSGIKFKQKKRAQPRQRTRAFGIEERAS